jgi:bacteriorhodopsin
VTDSAPSETANTPDAAAATTAVTAKKGSPWLWISIAVVVLIMGTLVPLINRWRKRKLLKQSSAQNLSFSHRTDSEPGNSDMPTTRKAA